MATPAKQSQMYRMLATMPQVGKVEWIGLRVEKKGAINVVPEAEITYEDGLVGDHYSGRPGAKRQVTLIQQEHFPVMSAMLGGAEVTPELFRRNIVVSGLNLAALKGCRFQIGDAVLEGTGSCAPCSLIEETFGAGAYNISHGHSGITARVVRGGAVKVGAEVKFLSLEAGNKSSDEEE